MPTRTITRCHPERGEGSACRSPVARADPSPLRSSLALGASRFGVARAWRALLLLCTRADCLLRRTPCWLGFVNDGVILAAAGGGEAGVADEALHLGCRRAVRRVLGR